MKKKINSDNYYPLVSVAITTYNGTVFLRKQLDSIISQTYRNLEIVISDDGSNSTTIDILNEYAQKESRLRWSRSPLERGFVKNTQNSIALSKGEIIFLCDQDDVWYDNKIALHVEAYKDKSVAWVYNRLVLTDEDDTELGYLEDTIPNYYSKERIRLLNYTWGSCIGGAQTSYRAHLVKEVMPVDRYAPAHDSWIQLALFPKKAFFIDRVLQVYRQHSKNELGWAKKMTPEELLEREKQAIADNFRYLQHLPQNTTLAFWKRMFFFIVYYLKLVRKGVRKLFTQM